MNKHAIEKSTVSSNLFFTFFLSFFFCGCMQFAFSQNNPEELQTVNREKIYIHLDKPNYYAGETIWFKVYLVNAKTHTPSELSSMVYVDLVDSSNTILHSKTISLNKDQGAGEFKIPVHVTNGDITIRAYTNYMRNFDSGFFFKKQLPVESLNKQTIKTVTATNNELKPDLQFFPESGHLVDDFLNTIAFKATDLNGKSISVQGEIRDENNQFKVQFKTQKFGLGKVQFIPKTGQKYIAKIKYEDTEFSYALPASSKQGVFMNIAEMDDQYRVSIFSNLSTGVQNLKLIALQHGSIVSESVVSSNKDKALIQVPKSTLTEGIVQFTLTLNNQPICERLAFVDLKTNQNKASLITAQSSYHHRELIQLEIALDEQIGSPQKANLSLAITDQNNTHSNVPNIKSYLQLSSEIKGTIENPNYYFNPENVDRKKLLDLLLITQGWRKYLWSPETIQESPLSFTIEKGTIISGQIKDHFDHSKSRQALVKISYQTKDEIGFDEVVSDEHGKFSFKDLNISDSTEVFLQAHKLKSKKGSKASIYKEIPGYYHIELNSTVQPTPELSQTKFTKRSGTTTNDEHLKYLNQLKLQHLNDSIEFSLRDRVQLQEVQLEDVIAKREKIKRQKRLFYNEPSISIDMENEEILPSAFPQDDIAFLLATKAPNLSRGSNSLTHSSGPLLIIDGFRREGSAIPEISSIDFIDILKGPRAAIFGYGADAGVIAIYTKTGFDGKNTEVQKTTGILHKIIIGTAPNKIFFEPNYNIGKTDNDLFDGRTTLLWKPSIQLNEQGKALVEFYAADVSTTYKVILEGVSKDGKVLQAASSIKIN